MLSHWAFAGSFYIDKSEIKINASFSGDTINLYGIHSGQGKIVIVMKGQKETYYIQKKEKTLGIWAKGERKKFKNVYRYYNITSEVSLDKLHIPHLLKYFEIGIENISTNSTSISNAIDIFEYKDALLSRKIAENLFVENYNKALVNSEKLVYIKYTIPRNIPEGKYTISVYTIHDGKVISISNIPLYIHQVGILKFMKEASLERKVLYLILSILVSIGFSALGYALLNGSLIQLVVFLKGKFISKFKNNIKENKTPKKRGRPKKKLEPKLK